MGIKENLKAVKEEISAEEQFLESVIKTERFFKTKKRYIIGLVVLLVLGAGAYGGYHMVQQAKLKSANEAYTLLLKDANNTQTLATLKEKNENLYALFLLKNALAKNDKDSLTTLSSHANPIVKDIASYELSQLDQNTSATSELFKGFVLLEEGYSLLQNNKVAEAKIKFAQIETTSPLKQVAQNLEHYQGSK